MNGKIYISDEGLGPVVRQSAIIQELKQFRSDLTFTLQGKQQIKEAKRIIPGIQFIDRFNNISWPKAPDGTPDALQAKKQFSKYLSISDTFLKKEIKEFDSDFIISDFVYEAFALAKKKKVPSFGIAHFTWDWFFSKWYPPPLDSSVLNRFFEYAALADVIYFPPFTPAEILRHYKKQAKLVPLIVRKNIAHKSFGAEKKFKVLLMDSGSGVLEQSMKKALKHLGGLDDVQFFISSGFRSDLKNVTRIPENSLFIDYISGMDLVIGRAGFNTISECIALRTPMLLLSEGLNPEMSENIINIKHEGLGSFISISQFENELGKYLPRFIRSEYKLISQNMRDHQIAANGAEVIAKDMLNRLR